MDSYFHLLLPPVYDRGYLTIVYVSGAGEREDGMTHGYRRFRQFGFPPLAYTKININVKVGVPNEEFGRRSEL